MFLFGPEQNGERVIVAYWPQEEELLHSVHFSDPSVSSPPCTTVTENRSMEVQIARRVTQSYLSKMAVGWVIQLLRSAAHREPKRKFSLVHFLEFRRRQSLVSWL